MVRRFALFSVFVFGLYAAAVPSPKEHLGYTPGDDYKLADYADLTGYFRKLAAASDRIQLEELGRSANGKPMLVADISSPENLRQLAKWKQISRDLTLGRASAEDARRLAREGRAIVWIDSGLHASEVAPAQHAFDLAHRMITQEDDETRRIRDRVILLQVPVINPDGLDWIAHWYRQNAGTPYELAPLPHLYQKYAGHDNNRDYFMLNLPETRHVTRMLFREWFPQIVYNQHQAPAFPARIFVPPYAEPLNPHIPATLMEGINVIGAAMTERFARESKPGVLSYHGYDAWWNGGLRSVPAFHNMHGILTETALHSYATPRTYVLSDLPERFANGMPTKEPSVFYERPWLGGKWGTRAAIDYMLTADWAILELAAGRSEHFLLKAWEMARAAMETRNGGPHAYIVPAAQWDASAAVDMLQRLAWSGIEVRRAADTFQAGGKTYAAGTYVLSAAQPFRAYLVDLMEPQKYPELRSGTTGPTKRPYDVAGWTLPMNMGVEVQRVDAPFEARLEPVTEFAVPASAAQDPKQNAYYVDLPARQRTVAPRVALYEPFTANMDTGWTQSVLDPFKVPHTLLHNADFASPLAQRFDALILASQSVNSILHGTRAGEGVSRGRAGDAPTLQRPEFTGGIGVQGLARLDEFVRGGGTLIAFDDSTALPVQFFPLPVRPLLAGAGEGGGETAGGYYSPGSIIRIKVDTSHPLAAGMPADAYAFASGGEAWDITLLKEFNTGDRAVRSVARYAETNLLASGWISGDRAVRGKHILLEARHGKGRVVLFGFRPQFRAQTAGTFKFLLNAIYSSVPVAKP
ncbi:MAG: hypothetical protein IT162_12995 [Bryobacterales bacterium]|nr:hypothetical protein [Bryobacterales bacterium]